jgi:hypothetical protein
MANREANTTGPAALLAKIRVCARPHEELSVSLIGEAFSALAGSAAVFEFCWET